ncbi:translocation/assembly module TamB domain-containing protein [Pararhizobium antarcticum]|uniref:Translocation and assembly module TamB C-terminal domain-containing protein n=1 Tax=Pararhizobium antarcticum TaxID=1798805 RepID=A0A657LRV9_9HYPH|nr:translocation/assembly module TamB domain-containing protein [Pararhizobium antarcticum]OJF96463.1 hypothetical protein AX760_17535 [Pararhizobium antarcticum]
MNHLVRFLKIALRFVVYCAGFIVVAGMLLFLFIGFTAPGARLAASMIEKYASTPDQIVRINDPSALLTGNFSAATVTLFDSKGIYAELRELKVEWSPTALFSSRFDAATVTAGSVRIERLPAPSTETQEVRSTFALPIGVKIDALTLPEVIIGKEIAGVDQFLALTGKVDATNESIASAFTIAQRDRPDAKAVFDIVFNPADNALKLEAAIDEPKGGLLSKLLQLPNEPAVSIAVTGTGPLSDWSGSGTASLDGTEILKLDGRHTLATDGLRNLSLKGGGAFGTLMPPAFRPLFEGTTDIDLAAAIEGGSTLRIERGTVSTGALTLSASGTVSQQGENNLQASLAGKSGPVDFRWPLAAGEAQLLINSANVSVIGDAQAAILDIAADIARSTLPQGRIDAIQLQASSDDFNLTTRSGALKTALSTGATQFTSPDVDRLVKGPVRINGAIGLSPDAVRFDPLTIESASIGGTLTGGYDLETKGLSTDFKLFALPAVLPDNLAEKFETTIAIAGNLQTGANGNLEITGLDLKSGTVEAAGSVSMTDNILTAALTGTVPEIGRLLGDASGRADFKADISGPLDTLGLNAEVTSSGATLAGRMLSDLIVTAKATLDKNSPSATVTATGALDGQAIDIKADLISENGRTAIPVLEARIGDNTLTGQINLSADFKPDGAIEFNLPDIGLLAAMAGEQASGDLAGSARITTVSGVTSVALTATGSGIKRGNLAIVKPAADIAIADLAKLSIKGSITAETVTQAGNRVSGLRLAFEQQAEKTGFALDGTYDGAPLTARGDLQSANGKTTINLASFAASPRKIPLKMTKPTVIAIDNGKVGLQQLTIQASGGSIVIAGSAGETLALNVKLTALPASLVNAFAPTLGADGAISGTVDVKGTPAAPVVSYDLNWAGASVAQARSAGVGTLDVTAKGQFADNSVTLDTTIAGAGGLSFRGGGTVGVTGSMPLAMKLSGDVPFSLISGLMAQQGFTLTGQAAVDIAINGTATAPQITGSISTSGARLVDVRRNLAFTDLAANVTLDGQQATISSLSGKIATGGTIEVGGTIGIAPGSGFPANLTIRLNNASYVDGSLFTANLDGNMTLTGPLTGTPLIGGQVTIRKAAITIPERLPAALSEINIQHKNAPKAVLQMESDIGKDSSGGGNRGDGGGIAFDLAVNAPTQIFVRGRGINAELGGNLTIRGTAAAPQVSGGFDMRRGRLEILGKRLDFSEGRIGFGGGLVPTIDLDATSTAGATTITVNVAGLANNPTVTFASSPALPQDEILAQLIFNRSLSNLSALQIAQLASAVSQLAGGQSTSLLDGLRSKLGVDDLDITTDENGGAQVRAGKYINDRTYIELQQGSDAGSSKAIINLDVGRGVKLRGETGTGGSGAGIFYEKEY